MKYEDEEQFQAGCVMIMQSQFALYRHRLFCIDNNVSKRLKGLDRILEGTRKKALGVREGASDLFFIGDNCIHYIELKMHNGVQAKAQKEFEILVVSCGQKYHLVYQDIQEDVANFVELMKSIIYGGGGIYGH